MEDNKKITEDTGVPVMPIPKEQKTLPFLKRVSNLENRINTLEQRIDSLYRYLKGRG